MSAEPATTCSDHARARAQQDLAATIAAHTTEEYEISQQQVLAAAISERDGAKSDHAAPNIPESDICALHGGTPPAKGKKARSSNKPEPAAT